MSHGFTIMTLNPKCLACSGNPVLPKLAKLWTQKFAGKHADCMSYWKMTCLVATCLWDSTVQKFDRCVCATAFFEILTKLNEVCYLALCRNLTNVYESAFFEIMTKLNEIGYLVLCRNLTIVEVPFVHLPIFYTHARTHACTHARMHEVNHGFIIINYDVLSLFCFL